MDGSRSGSMTHPVGGLIGPVLIDRPLLRPVIGPLLLDRPLLSPVSFSLLWYEVQY